MCRNPGHIFSRCTARRRHHCLYLESQWDNRVRRHQFDLYVCSVEWRLRRMRLFHQFILRIRQPGHLKPGMHDREPELTCFRHHHRIRESGLRRNLRNFYGFPVQPGRFPALSMVCEQHPYRGQYQHFYLCPRQWRLHHLQSEFK